MRRQDMCLMAKEKNSRKRKYQRTFNFDKFDASVKFHFYVRLYFKQVFLFIIKSYRRNRSEKKKKQTKEKR